MVVVVRLLHQLVTGVPTLVVEDMLDIPLLVVPLEQCIKAAGEILESLSSLIELHKTKVI
jgi:hypothetical protein